uniref:TetR/AcrR family transcriptional regulator n=1 Tax=Tessaracoccus bendigoensis TaxID=72764 RepID=UPI001C31539E|nr:TetR/AcrR family transcriptional regulator [Tessaracoccus bendigoensis]
MPSSPRPARVRLTPEVRVSQIIAAASRIIGQHGYNAMTLQEVADEVGMSLPGMLHYVHNKEGLLRLIIEQGYDRRFDPEDYIASGDPGATHPDGASLPGYFRFLIANNAKDPHLIRLFMQLGVEASALEHPMHAYFSMRPDNAWGLYMQTKWRVPPSTGGFHQLRPLVEMTLAAMDGLQIRSFREPPIDLVTEWARFEAVLFPSPLWDDYR